jgi:hypothetical protein
MRLSILYCVLVAVSGWVDQSVALPQPSSPAISEITDGQAHAPTKTSSSSGALPTVDLGYAIHQATINVRVGGLSRFLLIYFYNYYPSILAMKIWRRMIYFIDYCPA